MNVNNEIKLFCLLRGDEHTFPVEIATTETIGDLKKLIHRENKAKLHGIDASDLTVWKVSWRSWWHASGSLTFQLTSMLSESWSLPCRLVEPTPKPSISARTLALLSRS